MTDEINKKVDIHDFNRLMTMLESKVDLVSFEKIVQTLNNKADKFELQSATRGSEDEAARHQNYISRFDLDN